MSGYNPKSSKDLVAHRTEAILEDYDWMRECGESFENAAQRLGMKPNTLLRLIERHRPNEQRSA